MPFQTLSRCSSRLCLSHLCEDVSASQLAKKLKAAHPDMFRDLFALAEQKRVEDYKKKLEAEQRERKPKECDGAIPDFISGCLFCQRLKHSCAWKYRATKNGTVVTGGSCHSCAKACEALGCTRSFELWSAVDGVGVVVELSQKKSIALASDSCACILCCPRKKKA